MRCPNAVSLAQSVAVVGHHGTAAAVTDAWQVLGRLHQGAVMQTERHASKHLEVLTWEGWQEAWRPDPKADIQEPYSLVVRGMEDPQEEPQAVHCFCMCSALLGDILGVNRSMEHDLLFCHFILGFSCMYSSCILWLGILAALLYSAICSCVLVVLV